VFGEAVVDQAGGEFGVVAGGFLGRDFGGAGDVDGLLGGGALRRKAMAWGPWAVEW